MINSISFFLFEKLQPNIQTPKFQFLIPGNETPKLIINGRMWKWQKGFLHCSSVNSLGYLLHNQI